MDEYKELLAAQKNFFNSGQTKSVTYRIDQLKTLKYVLKEHDQELIDAVYNDFKKPAFETFGTEIGQIINEINHALSNIKDWTKPEHVPSSLVNFPSRNYILKEPYGCALIISPWNYPLQLSLLPLVGAIAAGNTTIIKPSELTPSTSATMEQLLNKYFDSNFLKIITGGPETSSELLDLDFNYIFFTGSTRVGKIIMKSAAKRLTPVTLELGGKSPCIVDETANLEVSAKRIAWGKFLNAGQTCIAPDYLFVKQEIRDELIHLLIKSVKELYGENAEKSEDYPRIINKYHFNRLTKLIQPDKVAFGGNVNSDTNYIEPTIVKDVTWKDPVMQDEIFGPVLPVLTYNDLHNVVLQMQNTPRPLALYLFTSRDKTEQFILENISFGGGAINDTIAQLGNHHLSFGGVGASGFGSYRGKTSFDCFSHQKSIMKKNFLFDLPLRYAPYNGKMKWLKTIFR